MSDFEQYYIHRKGDFVGNAPMWWAKGGNGYTSYILGAERFSKEDADALIRRSGDKYKAYLCADVDARLHLVYDVQDDKRLGTDEPCGWSWGYAAIASMQGEAVGVINGCDKAPELSNGSATIFYSEYPAGTQLFTYPPDSAAKLAEQDARIKELEQQLEVARKQPQLTVKIRSFPESNGKRNWTAMLVRVGGFDGLIGNAGGITIDRGEMWNRVAYEAERTRFLLGERDTEPHILDYGDDIRTPEEWAGEVHGDKHIHDAAILQIGGAE